MKKLINELKPGMIPAQSVYSENGAILVSDGIPLTDANIERLKNLHIKDLSICTICSTEPDKHSWNTTANEIFRFIRLEKGADSIEEALSSSLKKPELQEFLRIIDKESRLRQHSLRVTILSLGIGTVKGCNKNELELLATSALLHDIGIQRSIEKDRDHPLRGFKRLWNNLADIVPCLVCLQHHEHFDGTGLPLQLKRHQGLEFSRIVAVADYYDRLINFHDNTAKQAIFKIFADRGTRFDPQIVSWFEPLIDKRALFSPANT